MNTISNIEGRAQAVNRQSPFQDTIFSLSSGGLPSGVAIIRMSGSEVRRVLETMAGGVPDERYAVLRRLRDGEGIVLDHGLVLFFPGPASFTGEDCAEFHVHGGRAVVASLLRALAETARMRQAEAGEFTRRAFLNGKIDLTGAEGLADLIAAETEAQRSLAMSNLEGGQQRLYDGWRARLLHARAMIEAELDFSDESDIPGSVSNQTIADMYALVEEIDNHISEFKIAEIVRDGFKVALVGAPNAGKSSLLNALAKRDVAIVTDIAGTTRDLIEISLDIEGIKVLVTDTAGIRDTVNTVEQMGVNRAISAAENANLVLYLISPDTVQAGTVERQWSTQTLLVASKSDIGVQEQYNFSHITSATRGDGLSGLIKDLGRRAADATAMTTGAIPTRERHIELLRKTREGIEAAVTQQALELRAEQLRMASDTLGRITGAIDVEELLGIVFSQFCVGK